MAKKAEDEVRRLSVELRILEQAAEAVQSRINVVNAVIADLTCASAALEGLGKERENAELLVPIGGGSYIKARLETTDKVTVGVGAGVSVEKTLQEAKEIVEKRLEGLKKTRDSLQQQLLQIAKKIDEGRGKLEELVTELRKERAHKGV